MQNEFNPVISDQPVRDENYPATMLSFIHQSNGEKLIGTVFIAQGKQPKPLLILLPGFPGNEVNFDIAHAVRRFGWNVLVFNYRGSWGSSGNYRFSNSLLDIDNVLEYIKSDMFGEKYNTDSSRLVLAGHSMGGFAALKKSSEYDFIKHTAAFACFNMGYVGKLFEVVPGAKEIALEKLSMGAMILNGTTGEELYRDILVHASEWDLVDHTAGFEGKNVLMISAKYDHLAPIEMHHNPLSEALKNNVQIRYKEHLLETGHSFSDKRVELAGLFIEWLSKINF